MGKSTATRIGETEEIIVVEDPWEAPESPIEIPNEIPSEEPIAVPAGGAAV